MKIRTTSRLSIHPSMARLITIHKCGIVARNHNAMHRKYMLVVSVPPINHCLFFFFQKQISKNVHSHTTIIPRWCMVHKISWRSSLCRTANIVLFIFCCSAEERAHEKWLQRDFWHWLFLAANKFSQCSLLMVSSTSCGNNVRCRCA